MQVITDKHAKEEGTFVVTAEFTDEDGAAMTPTTIVWSLVDDDGQVINNLDQESITPGESVDIVLSGDDLQILASETDQDYVRRVVVIEATYSSSYGSGLALKEQVGFVLENLRKVS